MISLVGETKKKILSLMPARWRELKEILKISDPVLYRHLKELQEKGVIVKTDRRYELSEEEGPSQYEESDVEETVVRGLRIHGSVMDLMKDRGTAEVIGSLGILRFKDLFRTFKPDSTGRKYLRFLARLYIRSVQHFLGRRGAELNFEELRSAWLAVQPKAWKELDEREGLKFDFPSAWKKLKKDLDSELEKKMEECGLDQRLVFAELRAFSLPTLERMKLVAKDPGRIVSPPLKKKEKEVKRKDD